MKNRVGSFFAMVCTALAAVAQAQTEVVPVFTLSLPDRLLSAHCRGTGADGQTQMLEVLRDGTTRATPYGSARCPQGFSDGWALAAGEGAVFHHYYEDTSPRFSKLMRWQGGEVTELATLTHSGGGPARSSLVKPLVGGVLYGVYQADFFADQQAFVLDLASGQSRRLTGLDPSGSECSLVVPALDRPYVAGPQAADALTVLDSSCAGTQQNSRLRFVVDGTGTVTARPDLQGCTAFAALAGSNFGFCPFTDTEGVAYSRLLRISSSSSEEIARYDLRAYNAVTTHFLRAVGEHLVYAVQATQRDADNRVSEISLEVYRSNGLNAPVRIDAGSRYRNLLGRGSATAQLWALAVNDASSSTNSGNVNAGTLYYDVASGTARFADDGGFNSTVNASELGADLPGTDFTFFAAETPAADAGGTMRGVEPWRIERSTLSSGLLADMAQSPGFGANDNGDSRPKQFTAFNDAMYFWAQGTRGSAASGVSSLYRSGGQAGDPVLVFPTEADSPPPSDGDTGGSVNPTPNPPPTPPAPNDDSAASAGSFGWWGLLVLLTGAANQRLRRRQH